MFRQAKFELEHMMLVLKEIEVRTNPNTPVEKNSLSVTLKTVLVRKILSVDYFIM